MPDVIGISETKHLDDESALSLQGYEFKGCPSETAAGGVGIYVNEDFNFNVREDLQLHAEFCEDMWIELVFDKSLPLEASTNKINDNLVHYLSTPRS